MAFIPSKFFTVSLADWNLTQEKEVNEEDLKKLKAIKQSYNQRMINNKLLYEN